MKDNIQLMIPPGVKNSILLSENLSVMDFLQFPLPGIARDTGVSQPKSYFSTLYPTITDPKIIQKTLLPPLPILKQLSQDIELTSTGTQSIICQHAPGVAGHRFPVWILTYWKEVVQIWPLKKKWVLAEEALETRKKKTSCTDDTKKLISQVYNSLTCIPWAGNINGFPGTVPTECLTRYLTDDWLMDENENQILHLLERELARSRRSDGIHISNTFLITRLLIVYQHRDRDEHYATDKRNAWLRQLGQDLATGVLEKLVTIVNLDRNHWVSIVIDAPSSRILYGDSFGKPIKQEIEAVLTWWTNHHTATNFQIQDLPITCQKDGYSCGVFAWNAIAAHVLPETYLLVNSRAVADERLKMLLQVVDRHNEKVRG
jgi:Ulp1 protease family, C-terminal catalytic domain